MLPFHKYQLKDQNLRKLKEDKLKSQSLIIVIMMIKKMNQVEVTQQVEMEVKDHHWCE